MPSTGQLNKWSVNPDRSIKVHWGVCISSPGFNTLVIFDPGLLDDPDAAQLLIEIAQASDAVTDDGRVLIEFAWTGHRSFAIEANPEAVQAALHEATRPVPLRLSA